MIHLYTGEGKGKTTAAIGLCVRAAGRGFHVCFSQFMKGSDTGELHALKRLPDVEIFRSEKDFGFYASMSEGDKKELTEIHNRILDSLLERTGRERCLIVMDELTYPVKWGLLDMGRLEALLDRGSSVHGTELVMTGRGAGAFLEDRADYVTRMECVRHPYEKGIGAREGIEF